jgi:tRNA A-37 threonylcarbamoyl transferase component Bud32
MSVDTIDPRRKIQEASIISEGSEIRNKGLWQQRLKNKKNQDDWNQLLIRKNQERINQIKLKRNKMAPLIRKTRDLRASDLKLPANFNMPNRNIPNLPPRKRESPLVPKKDGNFNIVDGKLNIDLDSQNVNIINKRYVLKKKLGEGAFGAVFKAFDTQNNDQVVAIKLQTVRSSSNKKLFGEEIKNLQKISGACSSLVCIMDFGVFSESADLVFIVMDMAVGVSLTDYYREDLKIRQKNYTIEHCLFIALQILKGLHILHINNVAHLDIKPDNIIIDPETMNVKIIDLGLACIQRKCSGGGTPVYMVEGFTGNLLQRMGGDIYAFVISLLELTLRNRKYATSIMFEAERSNVLSKKEVMSAYVEDFIDHSFFLDMFKNFIQTDTMATIPELVEAERTWIILLTQYFSRGFSTFTDSGSGLKKILNVDGPLEE